MLNDCIRFAEMSYYALVPAKGGPKISPVKEARKGPVEILVVDSAEKVPSEN